MWALAVLILAGAAQPPLQTMSLEQVNTFVAGLQAREKAYDARVIAVARATLGTTYVGDPLGEGADGQYDRDPLMDLNHVDCVTFVEQTIALAAAKSYMEAFDILQKIRYRDGKIAFENRNHFMINDWIANNHFCRDVSAKAGFKTADVTRTVSRQKFFEMKKAPELGVQIPDETKTITYIPSAEAKAAAEKLPSPALILLVGKKDWLFVLHCGLFVRDKKGKTFLYNASSTEKKVVAADFLSTFNSDRYLGFTAYEIANPAGGSNSGKR
jgi:D-alanyl-D-alanine carboxypeptidase/D-alanyl-D-alanine-endopeptidase (penicillin-binding protein 4)